jgi:hypothetical protein
MLLFFDFSHISYSRRKTTPLNAAPIVIDIQEGVDDLKYWMRASRNLDAAIAALELSEPSRR